LKSPVEGAAAQPQCLGGFTDVPVKASKRLLDQEAFHILEAHIIQPGRAVPHLLETQSIGFHYVTASQQHCSLDGMIQFSDVARLRMVH